MNFQLYINSVAIWPFYCIVYSQIKPLSRLGRGAILPHTEAMDTHKHTTSNRQTGAFHSGLGGLDQE